MENSTNNTTPTITHPLQSRLRSAAAWASIAALLLLVGNTFNLWGILGITSEAARDILNGLMAAAAAFGIFNDPTNSKGY